MTDVKEVNKYEAIIALLTEEGPLSTWFIYRRLRTNGTGQILSRLRVLEKRGKVERIPGDRPGWSKWRLV